MYRNNEYYLDPTYAMAYANIKKEEKDSYIPWVYICSPYRGDVKRNIFNAKKYSRFAVKSGKVPMTPHIYFTLFLNDEILSERYQGLKLAMNMLSRCKEVWVFGDIVSDGMKNEIDMAKKKHMLIRYFTDKCEEVI